MGRASQKRGLARWWGALAAALLLLGAAPHASRAQAPEPVRVRLDPLFGDGTLLTEAWVPVIVTVENRRRTDFAGAVHLEVRSYDGGRTRHVAPVDLPGGATRRVVLDVFCARTGATLRAAYRVDEAVLGRGSASSDYSAGARSVVVLGDPPRLRGALLELDVFEPGDPGPSGRQIRVPVGAVRFDGATGDPMLPEDAVGWSSVRLLVAHAPALERASERQRRALGDWLRTGGRLLVFPRTEADLARPWLSAWAGPLAAASSDAPREGAAGGLVPPEGAPFSLACGEGQRPERFGCSAAVGFGRVFVAAYDGTAPAAIESGAPRELVRSVYSATPPVAPALRFGRGEDRLAQRSWSVEPSFGALRAALDPNESFRPALGLVALVLLLYVVVVGPLNFRWVQRRNRPTLALLTTPAAAVGCLVLMLIVGYLGKGVTMRYRRVELVEAVEGQRRAPARRYTGLFSTRPGAFDLPGPGDDAVAWRVGNRGDRGPIHRRGGGGVTLADFRAGLWETVFVREDRLLDLGGAVRFERDGARLAAVHNDSDRPLRGALVVDPAGRVLPVGDVAPHGSAPVPRASELTLGTPNPLGFGRAREHETRELARHFGLSGEEDARYVHGLVRLCGPFVAPEAPVLYARLPVEPRPLADRFGPEAVHRWIRVAPSLRGAPVVPAPPPRDDSMERGYPGAPEPAPPADGADAGLGGPAAGDAGVATDAGAPTAPEGTP